jgi:AcrR family transcriptional regulator
MKRIVKKAEVRRLEIIKASRELFLTHEYEKTSMQDIIEKLQIAKGTIYHYFKSKAELMDAVVQDIVDEYIIEVERRIAKAEGNALQQMQALVSASKVEDDLAEIRDIIHRPGNLALHTHLLAVTICKLAPLYSKIIEKGCQEGIFQCKHPLECAEFMLAGIQFLTDLGCFPWTYEQLCRRASAFPELIESLLHAKQGSFCFLIKP